MRHASIDELHRLLVPRAVLHESGIRDRDLARMLTDGLLHRVRRGWYMDAADWDDLWPESRHRAHVLATANDARGARTVYALTSAAVLWDLPLYRLTPRSVHVVLGDVARHQASDLRRHEGALPDEDVVERGGLLCTSLERTVYDLARLAAPEVAIAATNAALAQRGGDIRRYDADAVAASLATLGERCAKPGARGIRHARVIHEIADGRSQSTLESVSTLQLYRLGFPRPLLQVPVAAPGRGRYWMDMELVPLEIYAECDGASKYLDESLRSGRTLEEVLLDEKHREDWVRATTRYRVVRWGDREGGDMRRLAAHLAQRGIEIPRMPR